MHRGLHCSNQGIDEAVSRIHDASIPHGDSGIEASCALRLPLSRLFRIGDATAIRPAPRHPYRYACLSEHSLRPPWAFLECCPALKTPAANEDTHISRREGMIAVFSSGFVRSFIPWGPMAWT